MAPYLGQLLWYSQQNNIELDEHTKKLIEDAKANGINIEGMKSQAQLQTEMNQSLKDLVYIMQKFTGVTLEGTDALAGMADTALDSFDRMAQKADRLNDVLDRLGTERSVSVDINPNSNTGGNIPGFAAGTPGWVKVQKPTLFYAGEAGPEYMNIVPASRAGSDNRPVSKKEIKIDIKPQFQITINVSPGGGATIDPDRFAQALIDATENEVRGWIPLLKEKLEEV